MNTIIKFSFAILLLGMLSCQSNDPEHIAQEALKDEVIKVHDEVMPKMGEINNLRKQLLKLNESGQAGDSSEIALIKEAVDYLEKADEGMMDWMGNFKTPSKLRGEKTHEEILSYLNAEKAKVEKVKYDMITSITAATETLNNHKKAE